MNLGILLIIIMNSIEFPCLVFCYVHHLWSVLLLGLKCISTLLFGSVGYYFGYFVMDILDLIGVFTVVILETIYSYIFGLLIVSSKCWKRLVCWFLSGTAIPPSRRRFRRPFAELTAVSFWGLFWDTGVCQSQCRSWWLCITISKLILSLILLFSHV
jgi:hypothetical protein